MYGYDLAVFRFEPNSEIAIPTAFIGIGGSQQGAAWTQGKEPVWTGTWDDNKNRRLMWRDANGNGAVDTGEFSDVQMPHVYSRGFDIDENGNIWVAGKFNEHHDGFREGGEPSSFRLAASTQMAFLSWVSVASLRQYSEQLD
ncbi:MAG: hypothetical protein IPL70_06855 [Uliginosibacterium sp.]|nr:hypothetical protein [Uliginosibacterium sp.]